jgi:hypothetical protein
LIVAGIAPLKCSTVDMLDCDEVCGVRLGRHCEDQTALWRLPLRPLSEGWLSLIVGLHAGAVFDILDRMDGSVHALCEDSISGKNWVAGAVSTMLVLVYSATEYTCPDRGSAGRVSLRNLGKRHTFGSVTTLSSNPQE